MEDEQTFMQLDTRTLTGFLSHFFGVVQLGLEVDAGGNGQTLLGSGSCFATLNPSLDVRVAGELEVGNISPSGRRNPGLNKTAELSSICRS